MASTLISGLRSVALNVPDLSLAEQFYTKTWRLAVASRTSTAIFLRGSGTDDHLLALFAQSGIPQVRQVTLRACTRAALRYPTTRIKTLCRSPSLAAAPL